MNREGDWRQKHSDMAIINQFYALNGKEDYKYVFFTVFLFFVISRMLTLMASFSKNLYFNLALLHRIYDFLTSFVVTLGFIFLAWVMCQHLLFGAVMKSYSTLWVSWVSTIMISLRDFQNLDEMFELEPNITLVFFVFFIISVMLFLASIFVSLVMTIYGEIAIETGVGAKSSSEDLLREDEHWSFSVRRCCSSTKRRCAQNACCLKFANSCCKKKEKQEARSVEDLIERPAGGR